MSLDQYPPWPDLFRWLNAVKDRVETIVAISAEQVITGTFDPSLIPPIPWSRVLKAGSSLGDLETRSASDLSSGTLPDGRFPALIGDVSTVAGAVATTLATVNAHPGTYGAGMTIPLITVNEKGLVTEIQSYPIAGSPFTPGSVIFAGALGQFAQDNANLFWDNTNNRLGIGTVTPASVLSIVNTSAVNPFETHSANAQGIELYTHSNTNFRAPTLSLFRSEGTQAAPTAVANGDWLCYINIGGYNSGDAAYSNAFQWYSKATGAWTVAGTSPASLNLQAGAIAAIQVGPLGSIGFGQAVVSGYQVAINGSALAVGGGFYALTGSGSALSSDLTTAIGTPKVVGEINTAGTGHVAGIMYGTSTQAAWFTGLKTRSTTDNTADTIVQNNDGIIRLEGWGADGAAYRSAGYIELQVDGTPGASDMPGRWVVYTTPDGSATPAERMRITNAGLVGIGLTPTALLHLKAGTAAANTAPLKLTSGTNLTTAEAGAMEFTTDDFFATITTGAARKAFVLDDGARLTSGKIPIATTNGRLVDSVLATATAGLGINGVFNLKNYTVATLPAGTRGDMAYCTDLLAPAFFTAVVGGGAVVGPVFFDGTNWIAM